MLQRLPATGSLSTSDPNLAADMQTALNDLTTINGAADVGGSVTVKQAGNVCTVTFGGNLIGFDQPTMVSSNPALASVAVVNDGAGGTVVDNGASLQLENSLTITGEPLLVQGTGVNAAPNAPQQWFNVGPAPITNGQTIGNQNTTGRITGIAVDPFNANTIYIATAGGGAWKTTNDGQTWQPIFDAIPSVQQLTLNGGVISNATNATPIVISTANTTGLVIGQQVTIGGVLGNTAANGTFTIGNVTANSFDLTGISGNGVYVPGPATWSSPFTLSFNGATTAAIPANPTAAQVESALNALSTIGGAGGWVTVTGGPPNSSVYTVTFGGTLAGQNIPLMTVNLGIDTVTLLQSGFSNISTVQTIAETPPAPATFTITYTDPSSGNTATTGALANNVPERRRASVQNALQAALTAAGTVGGTVTVTGAAGGPYTVTFGGNLAGGRGLADNQLGQRHCLRGATGPGCPDRPVLRGHHH